MIRRIIGIGVIAVVLVLLLLYSQRRETALRVSGFIESDEIRLGSRVGGRVQTVHVEEGDAVAAGQLLVELEPFDLLERQREAAAQLAAARAAHAELVAGFREEQVAQAVAVRDGLAAVVARLVAGPRAEDIAVARAELEQAEAELARAESRFERMRGLIERGAAQPDEVDEVTRARRVALAARAARQAALDKLLAGSRGEEITEARAQLAEAEQALLLLQRGYRPEEIESARATMEAAEQRLAAIDETITELKITAPTDGVIETLDLQPGDLVPADAPVLSMSDAGRLWVRAYVPEDALDIALGQVVTVTVDSFPARRFAARIAFIARQAEFTPSNVQTPEERSKQVFRIKAVLEEGRDVLRAGMAADVWLDDPPGGPAAGP
ncbi:MAG: HlyD family secretion protein [Planctomycetota bacterium]